MPRKAKVKEVVLPDPIKAVVNKQVVLSPAAQKAFELLQGEDNKSFYYQFEFGTIDGDEFKVRRNGFKGCHAGMKDFYKANAIWSKMPLPGHNHADWKWTYDSDVIVRWNDWLVHRSPWSMVPVPVDPKFASQRGFVIQNLDLPANLIVNFCIASRIPCEHAAQVKRWDTLVQAGCPETLAFVLAGCFGDKGQDIDFSSGHHPMDSSDLRTKLVENFVQRKIGNPLQPFKESGQYHPCNKVWYDWKQHDEKYSTYLRRTYPPGGAKPVENNRMFKVADEGANVKHYELMELVAIGIAETKRLLPNDQPAPQQIKARKPRAVKPRAKRAKAA